MLAVGSEGRPLLRVLCASVITLAVLWTLPRNAEAQQLYVTEYNIGSVGAYDATDGFAINGNLISGLAEPDGLLVHGNDLYVSTYGFAPNTGVVGKYNINTGFPINASLITGLGGASGLALKNNVLYVANYDTGIIGEYQADSGLPLNANFITGLDGPSYMVISGNKLFVTNFKNSTVGVYNAITGFPLNAVLITKDQGLDGPTGIVVYKGRLLVANGNSGTVGAYDMNTGFPINAQLITNLAAPNDLAILGNFLYVSGYPINLDNTIAPNIIASGTVGKYNANTGFPLNANLLTGLDSPWGLAVKPK